MQLVRIVMGQNGLSSVRIYLHLERPKKGLLLYKVCIEVKAQKKAKQDALAEKVARHVYASYVAAHFPERYKEAALQQVAKEIGDYSLGGHKIPVTSCTFDVLDTLKPFTAAIEQAINMRGLALPGEEYVLYCDESFYKTVLAPRTPDVIGAVWANLLKSRTFQAGYTAANAVWQRPEPIVLTNNFAAAKIKEMYPKLKEFANQVAIWVVQHPVASVAIIVVAFVLTASVVGLVEAGLIGGVAIVGESGAITELVSVPASTLGRYAMTPDLQSPGPDGGTAIARGRVIHADGELPHCLRAREPER